MSVALGIDVGGTKVAAALVDVERGAVLATARRPTDARRGSAAVLADCVALGRALAGDGALAAVGLALCELVGPAGEVRSAETVDWRETELAAAFAPLGPLRVESDVRAAALAEARLGAGRGEPDFLYAGIGSGISHCLVAGGRPRAGAHGSAIGTGAPYVERWSGGLALARRTGHRSAQEALADPAAAAIVDDAARRLGTALAALVNALDPGALVIGGGLGLDAGYRERVVAALRDEVYDPDAARLPVRPAALGADAAVVGAALAAV
jgi:glucokinase